MVAAYSAADFEGGVVPKSVFESIQGENVNLELEAKTEDGIRYKITFNGQDIVNPWTLIPIYPLLRRGGVYPPVGGEPLIIHFEHEGEMPGQAMIEFFGLDLPDQQTLLFYYNDVEMKAEYRQKITIADGETRFILDHCSDYFIAERAKSKSLLADEADNTGVESIEQEEADGEFVIPLYVVICAAIILAMMIGVIVVDVLRRRKTKAAKNL